MKNILGKFSGKRINIRTKISLVLVLPLLIILSTTFYIHIYQDWNEWQEMTTVSNIKVGNITLAGLKHAMLMNDSAMTAAILNNINNDNNLPYQIILINPDGKIIQSTNPAEINTIIQNDKSGCVECHKYPVNDRPASIFLDQDQGSLRVSLPIPNDPECQTCHSAEKASLGSLLVDIPLSDANAHFQKEMMLNFFTSILSLGVIILFTLLMVNWLIERRIKLIATTLVKFASGDHEVRIPSVWLTSDELTTMADTFNSMADEITRQSLEMDERTNVRENAIVEERERISRELHDGIAQFLGYVLTKSQAASLLLEKKQIQKAMEHIQKIEEETHKQAIDVRASIMGLNSFTQESRGLAQDVGDYLILSNRFMDVQVETDLDPQVDLLHLGGETRLQILRILQESISNIRKHSQARHAWVTLKLITPDLLEMVVRDDGIGFDPAAISNEETHHFGLKTMKERAHSISANIDVISEYNRGTSVRVNLYVTEPPL